MKKIPATLALADGTIFEGWSVGAEGETGGEVVFNTSMSGYQEILTDPSYTGQIMTFTCPHIGNVGANSQDVESGKVHVSGMICREFSTHYANFRAEMSLEEYLKKNNVVGITGIDTRKLVLLLRDKGAQMGVIATGKQDAKKLVEKARALPSMDGLDLVPQVSCKKAYTWRQGSWAPGSHLEKGGFREYTEAEVKDWPHVVALDFGIKYNILRLLTDQQLRVTVVPANTTAEEILALKPDGIFLSNGPGDPAAVVYGVDAIKKLVGKKPMFGICLGHQMLGIAMGAPTFKLKFGHRGGNHPVRNEISGKVEITVQNHGFATDAARVPKNLRISHMNLNDNTVEGFQLDELKAFSVQYHPESSPGPNDAVYLFKQFSEWVRTGV